MHFRLRALVVLLLPLLLAACSDDEPSASPTPSPATETVATATPAPTAAAARNGPALEPDGDRIKALVSQLSGSIGPRPAGTASEEAGAELVANLLREAGYEVELRDFEVSRELSREAKVSVTAPQARDISSNPMTGSATGTVRGKLIASGEGRPDEFPPTVKGNIALIERSSGTDFTFGAKVTNAIEAGAVAVLIYNDEGGNFFGTLGSGVRIPAASISQAEGQALIGDANGRVEVEVTIGEAPVANSQNVVAKPPGKECETITGGHYDSVPVAPGANDNASGTATVVEIATVLASQGKMGNNCFVLFGGEELGLLGSRAYVDAMTEEEKSSLKVMLNFDMVGFGSEPWYLIGSPTMQTRATQIARDLGIETQTRNTASTGGGSDHASFMQVGIPAVFFYRADDPEWHQPGDTADRIDPVLLEEAARMGVAMLESLNAG